MCAQEVVQTERLAVDYDRFFFRKYLGETKIDFLFSQKKRDFNFVYNCFKLISGTLKISSKSSTLS
jgi:hypothetical protein